MGARVLDMQGKYRLLFAKHFPWQAAACFNSIENNDEEIDRICSYSFVDIRDLCRTTKTYYFAG